MSLRWLVLAIALSFPGLAQATTVLHGFTFEDDAFADVVLSDVSDFTVWNASSAQAALTGSDTNSTAFNIAPNTSVSLGFTNNLVVNGPGADIVVFELNVNDAEPIFMIANGIQSPQNPQTDTGETNASGRSVFYTLWDLSDFGVASGDVISDIEIFGLCTPAASVSGCVVGTTASSAFAAVGALNSVSVAPVPVPNTAVLLVGALPLLAMRRKRRR